MRDGDRQRVGGIVGFGDGVELKQGAHHFLHLAFVRTAVASDSVFDLLRCVFERFNSRLLQCQQNHAARLSHSDGGGHVAREE